MGGETVAGFLAFSLDPQTMFICVSANPAIDKRLIVPSLVPGRIHRARTVKQFPGGKAAHVAMVLRTLGETPHWTGLCGGSTGAELTRGLAALGITVHPCEMQQPTRTNLEIIDDAATVTEILEPGGTPLESELAGFFKLCGDLFSSGKEISVIFSGSLPAGVPPDLYARLIGLAQASGARTFLDTSGEALRLGLAAHPDFVKPNRDEATALLGLTIDSVRAGAKGVRALLQLGARSAALSLGTEGLLFCAGQDSDVLFAAAPKVRACSAVGSGDSALAGIANAIHSGATAEDILRVGVACGAANCLAEAPGSARLADIHRLKDQIRVHRVTQVP